MGRPRRGVVARRRRVAVGAHRQRSVLAVGSKQKVDAVEAVAASIREFGFRQPIVVDDEGVIICGHTRFKAAQQLGLDARLTQAGQLVLAERAQLDAAFGGSRERFGRRGGEVRGAVEDQPDGLVAFERQAESGGVVELSTHEVSRARRSG